MFLTVFPPFYAQEQHLASLSLLSRSYLKIDVSNLLSSLFTRERLWANRSCCSLQKSDGERFPPAAHDKRAMEAILSFSQANHSFAPLITKNELFTRKIDERIPNPDKGQVRMWRMRGKVFIFKNSQGPSHWIFLWKFWKNFLLLQRTIDIKKVLFPPVFGAPGQESVDLCVLQYSVELHFADLHVTVTRKIPHTGVTPLPHR